MPEIPILGQTKPADTPAVDFENLDEETKARLAEMAENDDVREPVTTFFAVVITRDGQVSLTPDLANVLATAAPDRAPSQDDIYGAAAVIQKDITTLEAAAKTQQAMLQMSRAMMQQQQAAQTFRGLDPSKLRG